MENQAVSSISVAALRDALCGSQPPIVIDVRLEAPFAESTQMVAGALRRSPENVADWAATLPAADAFVVYCVHGHEVGQRVAATLLERGLRARYLAGGLVAWVSAQSPIDAKPRGATTRWVTRERPKIDRIACPWLIARFVDADAQFLYVPASQVLATAADRDAIPYDVPDVHFSHDGERCSFDAFLAHYRLHDPALAKLALIVRGADTAHLELAAQSAGLAAISLGLSRNFADDHAMLAHGMVIYDALYRWCREGQDEVHTWNPQAYGTPAVKAAA
jgi:rhodanese-related sulfurtransferase